RRLEEGFMEKVSQEIVATGVGDLSRRRFLQGAAALGGSALLPSSELSAQAPAGNARVIDCHHHFGSPGYGKALAAKVDHRFAGFSTPGTSMAKHWQEYSPAKAIEYMDRN